MIRTHRPLRSPLTLLGAGALTAGLLSACGGGSVVLPPSAVSVALSGVTAPLQLGSSARLTAVVRGSDGSTLTGSTVTYSSSDSNAVTVAADGTVTARHLNASGVPVRITAAVGGVSGSLSVSTYGLDAAGGTYNAVSAAGSSVAPQFYLRFRDASGRPVGALTPVTITPPTGSTFGAAATANINAGSESSAPRLTGRPAVSGSYTATLSSGGQSYSKTFSLDASQVLPAATAVNVATSSDGSDAVLSGSLPTGAAGVTVIVNSPDYSVYNYTDTVTTLPVSSSWTEGTLTRGSYGVEIDAYSARRDTGASTPDVFNVSAYTSPNSLTY